MERYKIVIDRDEFRSGVVICTTVTYETHLSIHGEITPLENHPSRRDAKSGHEKWVAKHKAERRKKMMLITKDWLTENNACEGGVDYFDTLHEMDTPALLRRALADGKFSYVNWALSWLLKGPALVAYAVFASRSVLPIYEDAFPDDSRPRKAIEAAESWLKNPTARAAEASRAAAAAARAAAAAYAATYAAEASRAACSAAEASRAAADAACAALAARAAARAAGSAAAAARTAYAPLAAYAVSREIIEKGIELLRKGAKQCA